MGGANPPPPPPPPPPLELPASLVAFGCCNSCEMASISGTPVHRKIRSLLFALFSSFRPLVVNPTKAACNAKPSAPKGVFALTFAPAILVTAEDASSRQRDRKARFSFDSSVPRCDGCSPPPSPSCRACFPVVGEDGGEASSHSSSSFSSSTSIAMAASTLTSASSLLPLASSLVILTYSMSSTASLASLAPLAPPPRLTALAEASSLEVNLATKRSSRSNRASSLSNPLIAALIADEFAARRTPLGGRGVLGI
mmetsp:Transcript_11918/g.25620  ORF Transcript_11918/g.25620 Transcript_11918/m.25620 type:complete len:254 (-) Transcript_11918:234-995(-)